MTISAAGPCPAVRYRDGRLLPCSKVPGKSRPIRPLPLLQAVAVGGGTHGFDYGAGIGSGGGENHKGKPDPSPQTPSLPQAEAAAAGRGGGGSSPPGPRLPWSECPLLGGLREDSETRWCPPRTPEGRATGGLGSPGSDSQSGHPPGPARALEGVGPPRAQALEGVDSETVTVPGNTRAEGPTRKDSQTRAAPAVNGVARLPPRGPSLRGTGAVGVRPSEKAPPAPSESLRVHGRDDCLTR